MPLDTLHQASHQWATRPDDERFVSLPDLYKKVAGQRERSIAKVMSNRRLLAKPEGDDHKSLVVETGDSYDAAPTNWAFGQLASLAGAPAGYLRRLPADMAADCINYGLSHFRNVEEIGLLRTAGEGFEGDELRAATGPNYGRVWNEEIVSSLIQKFGDGVTGQWKVPGEFGRDVTVNKSNTTIYGSDRDIFVFLCDEKNRIEVPNRRNGQPGSLARGFFVWNSEVGSATIGAAFFMFDYVCCNRIVWGVQQFQERRIRHTSGAPDRWLEEITPVLFQYSAASAKPVEEAIEAAREKKLDDVDTFLTKRFSRSRAEQFKAAHEREEDGRPIETVWDAVTAVTAYARSIPHQDERVKVEREGGALLDLVKA